MRKVPLLVWWDCKGIIHYELLPYGQTITAEVYCNQLDSLNDAIKAKRPSIFIKKKVFFQHDNARPHTAKITPDKLKDLGWTVIPHPPYSSDLAPSDYHLFRSMYHYLLGKNFNQTDEVKSGPEEYFASKPRSFYNNGIKNLVNRWKKVVESDGNYILDH
jgi:[histone H3]-lysine36 N-dimethyltransferase SETMAR